MSLNRPALYDDLVRHFINNPNILIFYLHHRDIGRLLERMESFPLELVDDLLVLLLQSDNYTKDSHSFWSFVSMLGEFQEESKWICSGPVVDAIAKRILGFHKGNYIYYESIFEKILMKSKSLGAAEETPSLCRLLDSLTQDELSVPLAKCLFSHCHRNDDRLVEFLEARGKKPTWDPVLFELVLLLPIERRTMLVEFFKTDPNLGYKFAKGHPHS